MTFKYPTAKYRKIKKHEILNKQEWLFFLNQTGKKLQPLNGIVIHANHFSVFFFLPRTEPGLSRLSIFSRRGEVAVGIHLDGDGTT